MILTGTFNFRHITSILFWFWLGIPLYFTLLCLEVGKILELVFALQKKVRHHRDCTLLRHSKKIRFDGDEETQESNRKIHDEN